MQTHTETDRIAGLGTALATPFTADGEVDWRALERLVAFQIAGGVDFLVPLGSTGEASTLSEDEQLGVIETTLRVAEGRVPVLVGCTHNDTRALIERGRRFAAAGVCHVLSASPYYNKPTQEGIYRHYRALREATGLNVAAYTIPGRTAGNIAPETVARLVEDGIVFGIKESSGNIQQIQQTCQLVGARCAVFAGDDALTLPVMALGGAGVIAVASNAIPGAMRDWMVFLRQGDYARARAELARLLPLFDACGVEPNPIPLKAGMTLLGLLQPYHRLPLIPAAASTVETMRSALAPFLE
jgi:4-hydroxy-tetrahydrodipicolinate synthase